MRQAVLALTLLAGCASSSSPVAPGSSGPDAAPSATPVTPPPDARTPAPDAAEPTPPVVGDGGVPGPSAFRHPGVVVNREQLEFLRTKVAAGAEPWKGAFDALRASPRASHTYTAKPVPDVICGSFSNPSVGCSDEWGDAIAAYGQALLWYFTGDEAYARKAVEIMNAWSSVLQKHSNSNAPLQTGWAGAEWPRAAEIIRATYPGWAAADVQRFATMLRTIYLPAVLAGSGSNGNWELTMIDAAIGSAVFLDDRASFDEAVDMWRRRVPAYFYLSSDGPTPVPPPRGSLDWNGATTFMDGVAQETCRDLGHTQYGIASTMYAAETALIQGVDLYREQARRLAAAVELRAQFLDGAPVPSWLCGGKLDAVTPYPTWEIAYNELANRLGMSLPHTRNVVLKGRPTAGNHHMAWESMTHAEVGSAGIP